MAEWEFCKVVRELVGPAEKDSGKTRQGSGHRSGEKFTDRVYLFRMTAQRFTPDGLEKFFETDEYRGFMDEDAIHNEIGERLLAILGQEGWEPFFTDTRSSPQYFSWHLKRQRP